MCVSGPNHFAYRQAPPVPVPLQLCEDAVDEPDKIRVTLVDRDPYGSGASEGPTILISWTPS